jgi:hypothetical protein
MIAGWWRSQKLITLSVMYFYGSQVCFDFFQPPVWEGFHRGKRSWGPHWTIPGWVDWWVVKNRIWWRNTSIPTVNHPTTQFIWAFEFLFQREKTISWSWQFPSHSTRLTRPSVFFVGGVCFGGGMRTAIYTQPLEVQLFAGWGTCHLMTSAQTLRSLFRFNYFSRWPPVVVRGAVHPSWRPLGRLRTSSALSIGDWVVKTLKKYPYIYISDWWFGRFGTSI